MGMIYKITDKVWGISDMPWPFFYAIEAFVILKIIVYTIIFCFVTLTYPFLYIFGIWYLIKKKKKPNWINFSLYTILMGWYIFVITKYFILGAPMPQYQEWPGGDSTVQQYRTENVYEIKKTPNGEEFLPGKIYNYRIVIDDAENSLYTSNIQRGWRDEKPLKMSKRQINSLNGIYEWKSEIFFETQRQMFDYICENFTEMQKFKISPSTVSKSVTSKPTVEKKTNIADEYNDRLDEYMDDPEDELRFDPEVFDFQDD